ncbi:uncharacterized protein LOC143025728 [Oratosquilla oratoria]|uniref:uncharacterized protein LOC143025728 n=1 Tax=Oratosquilla oratoria TaxID=337810 RepID=UPI003F76853C
MTIISVYAPTLTAENVNKDSFYNVLSEAVGVTPKEGKLVILGDFNARVGSSQHLWEGVLGPHGIGKCNENGLCLLSFCAEYGLTITNTLFYLRNKHKTTWRHPRSGQWHLLDYVIVRQQDRKDVLITKVMRGADCWTDHRLVRTKLRLHLRPPARKVPPTKKINVAALCNREISSALKEELDGRVEVVLQDGEEITTELLTEKWGAVADVLTDCSTRVLGTTRRRHRDWFDDQRGDIQTLIDERNRLNARYLRNPTNGNHEKLKAARSQAQRELRRMQNSWWTQLAAEIQGYADAGNQQQFYSAIKTVYGPRHGPIHPVRGADGTLITGKSAILARWAEHYQELLNRHTPVDPSFIQNVPELPVLEELDELPTIQEVSNAVASLKNN